MPGPTYTETQPFIAVWTGQLTAALAVFSLAWGLYTGGVALAIGGGVGLLLALISISTLRTAYGPEGVTVTLAPYGLRLRHVPAADIVSATVREVSPVGELGGWGWRLAPGKEAFTVSGREVVDLELRSGRHLLLGTREGDEWDRLRLKEEGSLR